MKINFDEALAEVWRIILDFERHPSGHTTKIWEKLESFADDLAKSGWTRNDIYHLFCDTYNDHYQVMTPVSEIAVTDYIDNLLGNVAEEGIIRLPGELSDREELTRYVREKDWMGKHP